MPQIERLVVEALSEFASPTAAQNILGRVLQRSGADPSTMGPAEWAQFIQGPLMDELRVVFPIREPTGPLRQLIRELEQSPDPASAQSAAGPVPSARSTLTLPKRTIDLGDPQERERLASELAREEGITGVLLQGPDFTVERPALDGLAPMLGVVHALIKKQKPYKLFYSVFQEGQVIVRPLGPVLLALIAKREANLGRLMHVLNSYETKGGQP